MGKKYTHYMKNELMVSLAIVITLLIFVHSNISFFLSINSQGLQFYDSSKLTVALMKRIPNLSQEDYNGSITLLEQFGKFKLCYNKTKF